MLSPPAARTADAANCGPPYVGPSVRHGELQSLNRQMFLRVSAALRNKQFIGEDDIIGPGCSKRDATGLIQGLRIAGSIGDDGRVYWSAPLMYCSHAGA